MAVIVQVVHLKLFSTACKNEKACSFVASNNSYCFKRFCHSRACKNEKACCLLQVLKVIDSRVFVKLLPRTMLNEKKIKS